MKMALRQIMTLDCAACGVSRSTVATENTNRGVWPLCLRALDKEGVRRVEKWQCRNARRKQT